MIAIQKEFYKSLLEDAGLIKAATPPKPTFKPNKNLGEGVASKEELEYRQELINLDKQLYTETKKIIQKKDDPIKKIEQIDKKIDNIITKSQTLAEKNIRNAYNDGAKNLYEKMKKYGAEKPKIPENPERLQFLILQQQYNLEDKYLKLRGRLRQMLMVKAVMDGYHGKKT